MYKAPGKQTEDPSLGRGPEHTSLLHPSGLLDSSSSQQWISNFGTNAFCWWPVHTWV